MTYPLFSQRDERWSNVLLGDSQSNMAHFGCLVASLAMVFSAMGQAYDPGQMEEKLKALGGFQDDLILWKKIPFFGQRIYCADKAAPLDDLKKAFRAGKQVVLGVHIGKDVNPFKENHWVVMTDETFTINDPWYNETAPISDHYGPPAKAILGAGILTIPANKTPDVPTQSIVVPVSQPAPSAEDKPLNVPFAYDLEYGMTGDNEIIRLQKVLQRLVGYNGDLFARYGPKTWEYVLKFQLQFHVLKSDKDYGAGRFGPLTRLAINKANKGL